MSAFFLSKPFKQPDKSVLKYFAKVKNSYLVKFDQDLLFDQLKYLHQFAQVSALFSMLSMIEVLRQDLNRLKKSF